MTLDSMSLIRLSPKAENGAWSRIKCASIRSIDWRKTGYAFTSSRPIPHHCAPWPVKTKPTTGLRVAFLTLILPPKALITLEAELPLTAVRHIKVVRR